MQIKRLAELGKDVRAFLTDALKGDGVVIEDDDGRACGGVVPYTEASADERDSAWRRIEDIDRTVAASIKAQGVGEEDVVRLLLEND